MVKVIDRELIHDYIIIDLVIKTLEIDKDRAAALKSRMVIEMLYDEALTIARERLKDILDQMRRTGLRLLTTAKNDELFSTYTVTQYGLTTELLYSHHALRNHTMDEIKKIILNQK